MATESGIILPADSVGKAMRTVTGTTTFTTGSGGVVHQQVISIADPTTPSQTAIVGPEGGLYVVPRGGVRSNINWNAQAYSVTATNTLVSLNRSTNSGTAVAASTYTVTTGKTLRIQGIYVGGVLLGTTVTASRVSLVAVATGTAVAGSPVMASLRLGNASVGTQAANYGLTSQDIDFADGLEFPAGYSIGIAAAATTAAMHSLDITMYGYEY